MSKTTEQAIKLLDILPENDQNLVLELIKKMVIAWDPDFTKCTEDELISILASEKEIQNGDFITHENINWD